MPSSTFFRLPEEKRQRLLDAAWEEFTRVSLSAASINRIIQSAHIPRGSFYQYFSGKEDLFRHLFSESKEYFTDFLVRLLDELKRDLLAVPPVAFERLSPGGAESSQDLERFVRLIQVNPGIDLYSYFLNPNHVLSDIIWERVDRSRLRRPDRKSVEALFCLVMTCSALPTILALVRPDDSARYHRLLLDHLDLIRSGAVTPSTV